MADVDDGDAAAAQMAVASPEKVTNYLKRVIPVILEDDDGLEVSALEQAFADKSGIESLKKFIADPQSRALLVSRYVQSHAIPTLHTYVKKFGCCFIY